MAETNDLLLPGTLWQRVREGTERALGSGLLKPIPTECEVLREAGVDFQIRIAPSLKEKIREAREQEAQEAAGQPADPFAVPEPDLYLGQVTPSHYGMLNKFPVLAHHLLPVTNGSEDQRAPLTHSDFEALRLALGEIDGLAFYNAGYPAGASQPHKHLQLVPLPLDEAGRRIPTEGLLEPETLTEAPCDRPGMPFPHAACRADLPGASADELERRYCRLRAHLGLEHADAPYNLLVTRDWMLLVPRTQSRFQGVMINALGFAGGFLVRDRSDLEDLRRIGPMRVLRGVSGELAEAGEQGPG